LRAADQGRAAPRDRHAIQMPGPRLPSQATIQRAADGEAMQELIAIG